MEHVEAVQLFPMDPFQRFALEFREYCEGKLHLLTMVTSVVQNSETVGNALSKLFFQSGACPGDYDQINSLPLEIDRLRNCIDSIEVKTLRIRLIPLPLKLPIPPSHRKSSSTRASFLS